MNYGFLKQIAEHTIVGEDKAIKDIVLEAANQCELKENNVEDSLDAASNFLEHRLMGKKVVSDEGLTYEITSELMEKIKEDFRSAFYTYIRSRSSSNTIKREEKKASEEKTQQQPQLPPRVVTKQSLKVYTTAIIETSLINKENINRYIKQLQNKASQDAKYTDIKNRENDQEAIEDSDQNIKKDTQHHINNQNYVNQEVVKKTNGTSHYLKG